MKYTHLNERLNETIKTHIPENVNPVHFLMDILNLSRESAYRRLRNEILYTMQEAGILASKLNFSIDDIFKGIDGEIRSHTDVIKVTDLSPTDNYVEMLKSTIEVFAGLEDRQFVKAFYVGNKIPNGMLLNFKMLAKLRYIRWIHQTHNLPINSRFSEIIIPAQVEKVHNEYLELNNKIGHTTCVFDRNAIQAIINTIKFYYRINLLTNDEVKEMKKELLEMVMRFEAISRTGKSISGVETSLYISDLNIGTNILFFELKKGMSVHLLSSGKKPVISTHPKVCEEQKLWIDSLLKFSVLISKSNEILLAELVTNQNRLISTELDKLLNN